MSEIKKYVEDSTNDLMKDINRILSKNALSSSEKSHFIKGFVNFKLNMAFIDGKLEGVDESKKYVENLKP